MKLSTKQILIISAIVLTVFIVIGIWFYRRGKKQVTIQAPPQDNPNGGAPVNNPYAVSQGEISTIANGLFIDMDGLNWSGHSVEAYEKFNSLSDTDFVKVYNAFNTVHQAESGDTLKKWIEAESYAFDDVVDSILERMGRLNLI